MSDDIEMRKHRFVWWKEAFLAALTGLVDMAKPDDEVVRDAADMANLAAPYIAQAHEHFVVKGFVGPERDRT